MPGLQTSVATPNLDGPDSLDSRRIDYIPSPEEIQQACRSIRDGWTLNERRRRFVGDDLPEEIPAGWEPPIIDTSSFRLGVARRGSDLAS